MCQFMLLTRQSFVEFLHTSPKLEAMLQKYSTNKDRTVLDAGLENTKLVLEQERHVLAFETTKELDEMITTLEKEKAKG